MKRRDWPQVERLTRAALARQPKQSGAWGALAEALAAQSRLADALPAYATALRLCPGWVAIIFKYGNLLARMSSPLEAKAAFARVMALDPAHAKGCHMRANMLQESGRLQEAIGMQQELMRDDPAFAQGKHCSSRSGSKKSGHSSMRRCGWTRPTGRCAARGCSSCCMFRHCPIPTGCRPILKKTRS